MVQAFAPLADLARSLAVRADRAVAQHGGLCGRGRCGAGSWRADGRARSRSRDRYDRRHWLIAGSILPRAVGIAWPALGNEIIIQLKSTALVSTVTLLDITGVARRITTRSYSIDALIVAGILYVAATWLLGRALRLVERRLNRHQIASNRCSGVGHDLAVDRFHPPGEDRSHRVIPHRADHHADDARQTPGFDPRRKDRRRPRYC